jgi:hypothetical protein
MSPFEKESAGMFGVVTETGTDLITGNFAQIQCLTATTFSVLGEANRTGDVITGVLIPAGVTILGRFVSFQLTSGAVRAHRVAPPSA